MTRQDYVLIAECLARGNATPAQIALFIQALEQQNGRFNRKIFVGYLCKLRRQLNEQH